MIVKFFVRYVIGGSRKLNLKVNQPMKLFLRSCDKHLEKKMKSKKFTIQ